MPRVSPSTDDATGSAATVMIAADRGRRTRSDMMTVETIVPLTARPRGHPVASRPREARSLAADLSRRIRGEVRFGDGDRALYATDASNYRQLPIGVVIPLDVEDMIEAVSVASEHGAPILVRGGGTSLAGQCCNEAVVIDASKYVNHVLEVDASNRRARVEPGTVLDDLRDAAHAHGLTFGPDPATHDHNTLGGMIGNDSCGVRSVMAEFYGPGARTAENVEELEILTYDGLRMRVGATSDEEYRAILGAGGRRAEIYRALRAFRDRYADRIRERFPKIPRRVSGYNLTELLPENGFNVARALVGSECTCVTVLEATVTLIPNPKARSLLVLGYPSVYEAGDHVPQIREAKPIGLEGMDDLLVTFMKRKGLDVADLSLLPPGNGWLLVEFGGDSRADSKARAQELMAKLKDSKDAPTMRLYDDPADEQKIWTVREAGLGATAFVPAEPDSWPGWEDSAVPVDRVGEYLRDLRALFDRYDLHPSLYGHFGQGCIHCRIPFDLYTAEGVRRYREFTRDAAELVCTKYGGSLSGEHGDGQARADLLPIMFGEELVEAFREFKEIWDPRWKMNPGKVVDPNSRTGQLRLGAAYDPPDPETHFRFPDDKGSFARAALRCVGVGECRRHDGGTMCPSYMVLREEKHATRGRAHMLFEMLRGEAVKEGWKSDSVKESLDLCLACKGCKHDCPVNVDMATYKAEFLSHYYEGRIRPRHAYAFGLIDRWSRLAMLAPELVNFVTQTPGLSAAAKWAAGMARERRIPRFAHRSFTSWFRQRPPVDTAGTTDRVILWPDTFNNYFFPSTLTAAVEVLEHAGVQVSIPEQTLCCGRPLYDFGMLDMAAARLRHILTSLHAEIEAGTPVVGLEPSCVSVFRDEMYNLFPTDQDALRLRAQTFTLGEYLGKRDRKLAPPALRRRAIVHGHCHQKSVLDMGGDAKLLSELGLDFEVLESGCCGMAGSFGFEEGKYELSQQIGERVLLPAVREAPTDTLVIADGFSCREQIAQGTGRRAMHTAEVLQLALHEGRDVRLNGEPPESVLQRLQPRALERPRVGALAVAAAAAGVALLGGVLAWRGARRMLREGKLGTRQHPRGAVDPETDLALPA
jgi:FAD/FMN-containing dehydrogenase/Fe-S oxidoreductase